MSTPRLLVFIALMISGISSLVGFYATMHRPLHWRTSRALGLMGLIMLGYCVSVLRGGIEEVGFNVSNKHVENGFYYSLMYIVITLTHLIQFMLGKKEAEGRLLPRFDRMLLDKLARVGLTALLYAVALLPMWLYLIALGDKSPGLTLESFSSWRALAGWIFLQIILLGGVSYFWAYFLKAEPDAR